jgi:fatty-acyl-CoA synthase
MKLLGGWETKTLADLIDLTIRKYPSNEAVIFGNQRINYKELGNQIISLAKYFLNIGIKKGDKVAIWLSNRPEWIVVEFAIIKIGAVMVPLSTRLKAYDLGYILKQSDSTTLVMMDKFLKNDYMQVIHELLPELPNSDQGNLGSKNFPMLKNILCVSQEEYPGVYSVKKIIDVKNDTELDQNLGERQASLNSNDVINIPYTSGTTGFPKGVLTTHLQYIGETIIFKERLQIKEGDRFLAPAPFFANFGNYFGILLPLMVGGCTIPLESFDPEECIRLIEKERCTHFTGTPTMYLDIVNHPKLSQYDISSLRTGMTGAAPASVQLVNDIRSRMGIHILCNGYGMTENSGATTMTCATDSPEVMAATTGKPLPDVEIKIVSSETGHTLPAGKIGELCTKGWIVMQGYYKMPRETENCFDSEGWFHTGDLGYLDEDGNFCITGRLKDIFISGGTNVYPTEIENFLYSFPKIKQVAVIGVPDDRMGEVGFAFIVLKDEEKSSEEEIKSYCKARIANYKVPKYVKIIEDIPLAGVGKIQKFKLEQIAKDELSRRKVSI